MRRSDRLLVAALVALIAATVAGVTILSLLEAPGWVMFVMVMVLFATIWVGAFWLVVPSNRREERDDE